MNIVKSIKHFIRLYNRQLVIGGRFHLTDKQMPIQDDYEASVAFVETYCQHCPAIPGLDEIEDGNFYLLKAKWELVKILYEAFVYKESLKHLFWTLVHFKKGRKYYLNPEIHNKYDKRFFLYKND